MADERPHRRPDATGSAHGADCADHVQQAHHVQHTRPSPDVGAADNSPADNHIHAGTDHATFLDQHDAGAGDVVVEPGDSLWMVASRRLGGSATPAQIAASWPDWYQANRDVIGADPGLLRPGEVLVDPRDA